MTVKNKAIKYFNDNITEINFNLLKEFLYKQLWNECLTQINHDEWKLKHSKRKLAQLKTLIMEEQNESS